ncbi:unnamed protein product [Clavelina lepadiformis]|uniref:Uncharacterized protein n=1 Tax=Clavelina lepadiformis TaxID=159417 RepID=A0ABP0FJR8_CLALP
MPEFDLFTMTTEQEQSVVCTLSASSGRQRSTTATRYRSRVALLRTHRFNHSATETTHGKPVLCFSYL